MGVGTLGSSFVPLGHVSTAEVQSPGHARNQSVEYVSCSGLQRYLASRRDTKLLVLGVATQLLRTPDPKKRTQTRSPQAKGPALVEAATKLCLLDDGFCSILERSCCPTFRSWRSQGRRKDHERWSNAQAPDIV